MTPSAVGAAPRLTRRPGLLLALAGAAGLLAALVRFFEPKIEWVFGPVDRLTAEATAVTLRWVGVEAERAGSVVSHAGGFEIYVYYLCTAWPLAAVMMIGLVPLAGKPSAKLAVAAAGTVGLVAINQLRLLSLFQVGLYWPEAFDVLHHWVWEPLMLLCVGLVWVLWSAHQRRRTLA